MIRAPRRSPPVLAGAAASAAMRVVDDVSQKAAPTFDDAHCVCWFCELSMMRQVGWDRFKPTVSSMLKSELQDMLRLHLQSGLDSLERKVKASFASMLNVDPEMRADMQEVGKLAHKVKKLHEAIGVLRSEVRARAFTAAASKGRERAR